MPKVYHYNDKAVPNDAIYVGRPTRWGNPFAIGKDGNREEVIAKYRKHVEELCKTSDLFMADLRELAGKDLVCWCAPQACHADILLALANPKADDE